MLKEATHFRTKQLFILLYYQGAPESLLERCSYLRVGKQRVEMNEEIKSLILEQVSMYGTGKYQLFDEFFWGEI